MGYHTAAWYSVPCESRQGRWCWRRRQPRSLRLKPEEVGILTQARAAASVCARSTRCLPDGDRLNPSSSRVVKSDADVVVRTVTPPLQTSRPRCHATPLPLIVLPAFSQPPIVWSRNPTPATRAPLALVNVGQGSGGAGLLCVDSPCGATVAFLRVSWFAARFHPRPSRPH